MHGFQEFIQDICGYCNAVLGDILTYSAVKAGVAFILVCMFEAVGGDGSSWGLLTNLVIADFVLGVSAAVYTRSFKWSAWKGTLFKVVLYWAAVATTKYADDSLVFALTGSTTAPLSMWKWLIFFLCITELISIMQKLDTLGLKLPVEFIQLLTDIRVSLFTRLRQRLLKLIGGSEPDEYTETEGNSGGTENQTDNNSENKPL